MTKKKMGNMTSLSKLSGIKSKPADTIEADSKAGADADTKWRCAIASEPLEDKSAVKTDKQEKIEAKVSKSSEPAEKTPLKKGAKKKKTKHKLVTVNIKIREDQKRWLADTASTVRDNNTEPVPPAQRVYPQHLIGVAIDLLEAAGVDWGEVKNVEELRKHLNL